MTNQLPLSVLQQYWGYTSFRGQQLDIINNVMKGNDTFVVMPTGGGKSLCYQIPALISSGITIVVSPLIALMEDQADQLIKMSIPAAACHSGLSIEMQYALEDKISEGQLKIIYCSPEKLLSEHFIELMANSNCNLLAIDEAHCISQWGHDFRPAYRRILDFKNRIHPRVTMALTASATQQVQKDIIHQLHIPEATFYKSSVIRSNLQYQCLLTEQKTNETTNTLVLSSSIIYCGTRKRSEQMATYLNQQKVKALPYHAGMHSKDRKNAQSKWMQSHDTAICATSAFGMGIDKLDVRQVIHLSPPDSLEAYYQEAGRAGRDSLAAHAILMYNDADIKKLQNVTNLKYPSNDIIRKCYDIVCNSAQIAIGDGHNKKYFIDIIQLAQQNKIPNIVFVNALNLIEKFEYWLFCNDDKSKHSATFTCKRADIDSLQKINHTLYDIAIHLLRLHGDIFHHYATFSIQQDASIMGISYQELLEGLQQLDRLGIINFNQARYGSSIFLLQGRVKAADLIIDKQFIAQQKTAYQNRIDAMIAYINDKKACRNLFIAKYFGEEHKQDCGQCDNCKNKIEKIDTNAIMQSVLDILTTQKTINIASLSQYFNEQEVAFITQNFDKMLQEGTIKINGTNIIFAK